jgi:putative transposase
LRQTLNQNNKYKRHSIRLKDYDYSNPGEYFVTLCTYERECILGKIVDGEMQLSEMGHIARQSWEKIPIHFPNIELDEFIIMPNHLHGIIIINDYGSRDVQLNVPTRISPKRGTLSVIIRTFKAAVTTECRRNNYFEFRWQPRFYEHIVRDDKDLRNVREYIINNPLKWSFDKDNSENIPL